MTFKYGLTIPAHGPHKLVRFRAWAHRHMPDLEYHLPPQAPIKTKTLTVRLKSQAAGEHVLSVFPKELP